MKPEQQTEYIVQCLRESGSMYEKDAHAFLAEHDAHVRTGALAEVATWLIKKSREYPSRNKLGRTQADTAASLASQVARGAVRPNNLQMLPPNFFEPGHTYSREHHGDTIRFLVEHVSTSPDGRLRVAHGWRTRSWDPGWEPSDSDDFTIWADVTEGGIR
jgi:hypothetical protein